MVLALKSLKRVLHWAGTTCVGRGIMSSGWTWAQNWVPAQLGVYSESLLPIPIPIPGVFLNSPGWPGTPYEDNTGWNSRVLGLKACSITLIKETLFLFSGFLLILSCSLLSYSQTYSKNLKNLRAEVMAQQLATLAFLPEDLGLVLGTCGVGSSQPSVTPILGDQTPTLASVGTRHA